MTDPSPAGLSRRSHPVVIGLGGNIGAVLDTLNGAIARLDQTPGITVNQCSSWYQSRPVGPPQPDYLNGCALLTVTLSPLALLESLLVIEQQFGRIRKERWGPRTLDLDLIFYGDRHFDSPRLQIPHPQLYVRPFVLVPLAEIAPDWIDPRTGQTVQQLLTEVDHNAVWLVAPARPTPYRPPCQLANIFVG